MCTYQNSQQKSEKFKPKFGEFSPPLHNKLICGVFFRLIEKHSFYMIPAILP